MGSLPVLLCSIVLAGGEPDTVRVGGRPAYVVTPSVILSLADDTVRARLPWSSPAGLRPTVWCEGPDGGLLVLEGARGGRIVHLGPLLRTVSVHPLPDGLRPSDLKGAVAHWDGARGLSLATVRPPRLWTLGFLSGPVQPPVPVDQTDSVFP